MLSAAPRAAERQAGHSEGQHGRNSKIKPCPFFQLKPNLCSSCENDVPVLARKTQTLSHKQAPLLPSSCRSRTDSFHNDQAATVCGYEERLTDIKNK